MFEFESDSIENDKILRKDNFDVELGLAISRSLTSEPGSQIKSPEEIQEIVKLKLKLI